ncbi:hypothetical protein DYB26_013528, partial [Aphanomyces astaci]
YAIGRTMFETDRLPSGWAQRMDDIMDEIWVPTTFAKSIFEAAGVPANKVVVVPEAIDVEFFDPDTATPLPLGDITVWNRGRSKGIYGLNRQFLILKR